ncbi:DUF1427 family protein [Streptomyces sp. NPDC001220]
MKTASAKPVAFLRAAALSFAAGLLIGAVYWAMDIRSPAPPLLGLTGLVGIVAGERTASAVRSRLDGTGTTHRSTPACSPSHEDPAHEHTD